MTRTKFYAKLTDEELIIIDDIIETLDYETRTDFITALLKAAIYGSHTKAETQETEAIASCAMTLSSLRTAFFEVLDEYAFPVIAMRGADAAYTFLHDDMKTWMYNHCRVIPDEEHLKSWLQLYYVTRRSRIVQYRIKLMTDYYKEDNGIEDSEDGGVVYE